jgi:hypothetical protein
VQRARRGRLKLYIGFAAGVGKTYRMLEEAHALRKRGVDVVVGFVETHGRAETAALLEGLEVVPRRRIEYWGLSVEEMDVDAVLARRPAVALEMLSDDDRPKLDAWRVYHPEDVEALGASACATRRSPTHSCARACRPC